VGQLTDRGLGDRAVPPLHPSVDGGFGRELARVPSRSPRDERQVARERPREARPRDRARPIVSGDEVEGFAHRALGRIHRREVCVGGLQERVELGHRHGGLPARLPAQVVDARLARDQAESVDRGLEGLVLGEDPLGTELDDLAVAELDRVDPPAHAVAGLDHDDVEAGVVELQGRGEAREPGPDHEDVPPSYHGCKGRLACVGLAPYGNQGLERPLKRGGRTVMSAHPRQRPSALSRRDFLRRSLGVAVALPSAAAILAACSKPGSSSSGGSATGTGARVLARPDDPVTLPMTQDPIPTDTPIEGGTLNVYNWDAYM